MILRLFHRCNRKQHRYLTTLTGNSEHSVRSDYHIPEQIERRIVIFSERLYLQAITKQAVQNLSQSVILRNGLLPIISLRTRVSGFFHNVRFFT